MKFTFSPFRALSLTDLYSILQLREQVFILEQTCLYNDLDGKDNRAYHAFLKENDTIVAYARFYPKGAFYEDYTSIGRVLVHPSYRNKGLAHRLIQEVLKKIEIDFEKAPIKISAQTYLKAYYEQYGFKKISAEYLEDDIPHILMIKV